MVHVVMLLTIVCTSHFIHFKIFIQNIPNLPLPLPNLNPMHKDNLLGKPSFLLTSNILSPHIPPKAVPYSFLTILNPPSVYLPSTISVEISSQFLGICLPFTSPCHENKFQHKSNINPSSYKSKLLPNARA